MLESSLVWGRNHLEIALLRAWEDVLGVRPIHRESNFFDLGGDSLQAAEVLSLVERQTGVRLPLNEIGDHPTVAGLAAAVERSRRRVMIGPVMPVRSEGTEPALFLFDPVTVGPAMTTVDVLRHIDPAVPTYLVHSSLAHGNTNDLTLDGLIPQQIDAIRRIQPHGPYRLAGICSGGYVALGVAAALRGSGEEVELLAVAHAGHPRMVPFPGRRWVLAALAVLAQRGLLPHGQAASLYCSYRALELIKELVYREARGRRRLPAYLLRRRLRLDAWQEVRRFGALRRSPIVRMALRDWAVWSYHLPHWPDRLVLLAAADSRGDPHDRLEGWNEAAARLEIVPVPWGYRDLAARQREIAGELNRYLRTGKGGADRDAPLAATVAPA